MNAPDPRLGRLLLVGEDYGTYGAVGITRVGSKAAAAISVGADDESPSHQFKANPDVPNEDALCVMEAGNWAAYAVADAHYGPESSQMLISRLHQMLSKIRPTDSEHLNQMVEFLKQGDPAYTDSETTLLIVIYDREQRSGFGVSFGDSSFVIVGPGRTAEPVNQRDNRYVSSRGSSLRNGANFTFTANPGDMMLTFTDGVDECNYRSPATSIRPHHLEDLVAKANGDTLEATSQIVALALSGVDDNPGGEDNIALVAANA